MISTEREPNRLKNRTVLLACRMLRPFRSVSQGGALTPFAKARPKPSREDAAAVQFDGYVDFTIRHALVIHLFA